MEGSWLFPFSPFPPLAPTGQADKSYWIGWTNSKAKTRIFGANWMQLVKLRPMQSSSRTRLDTLLKMPPARPVALPTKIGATSFPALVTLLKMLAMPPTKHMMQR